MNRMCRALRSFKSASHYIIHTFPHHLIHSHSNHCCEIKHLTIYILYVITSSSFVCGSVGTSQVLVGLLSSSFYTLKNNLVFSLPINCVFPYDVRFSFPHHIKCKHLSNQVWW